MTSNADRVPWSDPPEVADVRRWQLLVAGRHVIERKGAQNLTVEDVAKQAHVAKGTFYVYFASREEFFDALRAALAADLLERVTTKAQGPWDGIFTRMIQESVAWAIEIKPVYSIFHAGYMARVDRPSRPPMLSLMTAIIRDGVALGIFQTVGKGDHAIEATAAVIYDVLGACTERAAAAYPDATNVTVAEALARRALLYDEAKAGEHPGWSGPA